MHHGAKPGNGTAAQVIAIAETARQHNTVIGAEHGQVFILMPKLNYFLLQTLLQGFNHISVAIAAGKKYDTTDASTLVIANPEAEKELLILISPFCEHCKVLFLNLKEKISSAVLNEYRIKIIFADEPAGLPVSGAAICEYYLHGPQGFIDFMSKWYTGSHSIVKYRKQFAGYKLSTEYNEELARQKEWIRSHNISGTPMMFVESHRISFFLLESLIVQNN